MSAKSLSSLDSDNIKCVHAGSTLAGWTLQERLGDGRFSEVWRATDETGAVCALKLYIDIEEYEYYYNEICVYNALNRENRSPNIIGYLGTFAHVMNSESIPRIIPCVKLQLGGDHIGRFLRRGVFRPEVAKQIMRQLLSATAFLHSMGIIHTDIKPENILVEYYSSESAGGSSNESNSLSSVCADESTDSLTDIKILLGDLGTATKYDKLFKKTIGTVPYLAPELLIASEYSFGVDIWAILATCFELVTGKLLFDVFDETEMGYGSEISAYDSAGDSDCDCSRCRDDTDGKTTAGSAAHSDAIGADGADSSVKTNDSSTDGTSIAASTSVTGKSHSTSSDGYDLAYRHLMIIEKIIGRPSKAFCARGRSFYNSRGKLMGNPAISRMDISETLTQLPDADRDLFVNFLMSGLTYNDSRPTCDELLKHEFLI